MGWSPFSLLFFFWKSELFGVQTFSRPKAYFNKIVFENFHLRVNKLMCVTF